MLSDYVCPNENAPQYRQDSFADHVLHESAHLALRKRRTATLVIYKKISSNSKLDLDERF